MLNAPHVFMAASESASVCLEVPFYSNSKLLRTDPDATKVPFMSQVGGNQFATVNFFIINPLVAPTSGTTSISVIVNAVFEELEFYAPYSKLTWVSQCFDEEEDSTSESVSVCCDKVACKCSNRASFSFNAQSMSFTSIFSTLFDNIAYGAKKVTGDIIDAGRGLIRDYTGLDNGNQTVFAERDYVASRAEINGVDNPVPYNKLDPYHSYDRVTREYTYDTDRDEMAISNIVSKPQFLSTFEVNISDPVGKLLFSRPITPQQEVYLSPSGNTPLMTGNLQVLSYLTRYWRGSLKIHIQSNMSNFHYCKLAVFKSYSPNTDQLTLVPTYDSVQGLMVDYIEFSGGGQTVVVDLPFVSPNEHLECTRDWKYNALQHGQYYLFLAQPLVYNGSVSTSVNFNIYLSAGEDFQFAGYATDLALLEDAVTINSLAKTTATTEDKKGIAETPKAKPEVSLKSDATVPAAKDTKKTATEAPKPKPEVPLKNDALLAQAAKDAFDKKYPDWKAQGDVEVNEVTSVDELPREEPFEMEAAQYRPIYSVRDFVRRPTPGIPVTLSAASITLGLGVTSFDIANLVGQGQANATDVRGALSIVRRFFVGLDGGVRVKFKIVGASNAQVYFVPPGCYVSATPQDVYSTTPFNPSFASVSVATRQGFQYDKSRLRYQGPVQTASNYYLDGTGFSSVLSSTTGNKRSKECEIDVCVPNMNPYRFTGDGTGYVVNSAAIVAPVLDLGTLVVAVKVEPDASSGTNAFFPVVIYPYVSLGDEARLGFQVKSPILAYPTILEGTSLLLSTVFQGKYAGDIGTLANPISAAPASYIG
jgi:hypothetical protein